MAVVLTTFAIVAISLAIYLGLNRIADAILFLADTIEEHRPNTDFDRNS